VAKKTEETSELKRSDRRKSGGQNRKMKEKRTRRKFRETYLVIFKDQDIKPRRGGVKPRGNPQTHAKQRDNFQRKEKQGRRKTLRKEPHKQ